LLRPDTGAQRAVVRSHEIDAPLVARGAFSVVPVARGRWSTVLVPSPRLEAMEAGSPGEHSAHPLFVFPARLAPPKRPELFIEAMAALAVRVPEAEGVVLGEGPARAVLEARIRATGAPVRLLGHVEDPTPWYRQAWGVCLLSDFESLPFVVQEAMWAGRPVISSDLPGVKWFAGETVRYVSGHAATVEALVELCDPSVRDARGRVAQARARSRLSADTLYQTLVDAYGVRARPPAREVR
jgi:glycosyltransferase involved in cell wall biosynthesis